jgi:hypothetical protein
MAKNIYDWSHLRKIKQTPHLLGHLCGKTKLTQLHSDWIRYTWDSKVDVGLMGHRGSYKSTSVLEIGALYYLLFHPNARLFIVRKTYTQYDRTLISSRVGRKMEVQYAQGWDV